MSALTVNSDCIPEERFHQKRLLQLINTSYSLPRSALPGQRGERLFTRRVEAQDVWLDHSGSNLGQRCQTEQTEPARRPSMRSSLNANRRPQLGMHLVVDLHPQFRGRLERYGKAVRYRFLQALRVLFAIHLDHRPSAIFYDHCSLSLKHLMLDRPTPYCVPLSVPSGKPQGIHSACLEPKRGLAIPRVAGIYGRKPCERDSEATHPGHPAQSRRKRKHKLMGFVIA